MHDCNKVRWQKSEILDGCCIKATNKRRGMWWSDNELCQYQGLKDERRRCYHGTFNHLMEQQTVLLTTEVNHTQGLLKSVIYTSAISKLNQYYQMFKWLMWINSMTKKDRHRTINNNIGWIVLLRMRVSIWSCTCPPIILYREFKAAFLPSQNELNPTWLAGQQMHQSPSHNFLNEWTDD